MKKNRFLLCPGPLKEQDGKTSIVSFHDLIGLYKLNPKECLNYDRASVGKTGSLIQLGIRYNGDYREYLAEKLAEAPRYKESVLRSIPPIKHKTIPIEIMEEVQGQRIKALVESIALLEIDGKEVLPGEITKRIYANEDNLIIEEWYCNDYNKILVFSFGVAPGDDGNIELIINKEILS